MEPDSAGAVPSDRCNIETKVLGSISSSDVSELDFHKPSRAGYLLRRANNELIFFVKCTDYELDFFTK